MYIDFLSDLPIFRQIADGLSAAILAGVYPEGEQIPSITEIAVQFKINPATALKGINILVEQNIVYKKRGLGMYVTEGAITILQKQRRDAFFDQYIATMVREALRLHLSQEALWQMIRKGFEDETNTN